MHFTIHSSIWVRMIQWSSSQAQIACGNTQPLILEHNKGQLQTSGNGFVQVLGYIYSVTPSSILHFYGCSTLDMETWKVQLQPTPVFLWCASLKRKHVYVLFQGVIIPCYVTAPLVHWLVRTLVTILSHSSCVFRWEAPRKALCAA